MYSQRIYQILGGDTWFENGDTPLIQFNPESQIRATRSQHYATDDQAGSSGRPVASLLGLLASYAAVDYHRAGNHRFPAQVPEFLSEDGSANILIHDCMSWQEWFLFQIDALIGAYPITIQYKNVDNEDATLTFPNVSEALAEMIGMLLSMGAETDIQTELAFKTITEAIAARNSATQAADYAKANAEFLGYRGNTRKKDLPLTITPGAKSIRDALKESKQKIARWQYDDKASLSDLIGRTLIGVEIIKSAFMRNFDPNEPIPGEGIIDQVKADQQGHEDGWREFLDEINNPVGVRQNPRYPRPHLDNLAQEENDQS